MVFFQLEAELKPLTKISKLFRKQKPKDTRKKRWSIDRSALPGPGGRSSRDDTPAEMLGRYEKAFSLVDPWVPHTILKVLSKMTVIEPEFSKAIFNFQAIANTGHKVLVEAPENRIPAIMSLVNNLAEHLNIDSQINNIIDQISRNGAGSAEAEINGAATGIKRIILVPPYSIRFLKEKGEWQPHQALEHTITGNQNIFNLIPLNSITYRYDALQVLDNSPYGIPPFLAAMGTNLLSTEILKEMHRVVENLTLFGKIAARIPPPPELEQDETPESFRLRYQEFIKQNVNALAQSSTDGFIGMPNDLELDNFSVAQNLRGISEVTDAVNRKLYNGLKSDPGLLSDHATQTETFLTIIYKILIHYTGSISRIVKRMLEYFYSLHLLLSGAFVGDERVRIRFNDNNSIRPQLDALAERYKTLNVRDKLNMGVISPDRAAQELGYSEFYDEEWYYKSRTAGKGQESQSMAVKRFGWNHALQRYDLLRDSLNLDRYSKKKEDEDKKRAELTNEKVKGYIENYLEKVLPYFSELKADVIDYALKFFKANVEAISQDSEIFRKAIIDYIAQDPDYQKINDKDSWLRKVSEEMTIKAGKDFIKDLSAFPGKKPDFKFIFGEGDRRAMELYARCDCHFFSSFIDNEGFGGQIKEFTNKFLARGESIHGDWSNAVEKEFQRLFGNAIDVDFEWQVRRIITTTMSSIKNRTHFTQLDRVGFKYGRINGMLDPYCKTCKPLQNTRVLISKAMETVKAFEDADTIDEALEVIINSSISNDELKHKNIKEMVENGEKIPPFHCHCYCYVEGENE